MPGGFDEHPENINRNGRPKKGTALTDVLRDKVDANDLAERLLAMVEAGDLAALKYVYDRVDGKPKESMELDQKGDLTYRILKPEDADD